MDCGKDGLDHGTGDRHFGKLEGDGAGVTHHAGADLDQLQLQAGLDSSCKRNTWFEGLDFVGHCFGGRSPAEGLSGAIVQQRSHLV